MGWKTRENVVVLDFLAVDNSDFTRKIAKNNWVKNSSKCWSFDKIKLLDKNLTIFLLVVRRWQNWHFHSFWSLHRSKLQIWMVLVVLEIRSSGTSGCQRLHDEKLSPWIYLSRLCTGLKVLSDFPANISISKLFSVWILKIGVF